MTDPLCHKCPTPSGCLHAESCEREPNDEEYENACGRFMRREHLETKNPASILREVCRDGGVTLTPEAEKALQAWEAYLAAPMGQIPDTLDIPEEDKAAFRRYWDQVSRTEYRRPRNVALDQGYENAEPGPWPEGEYLLHRDRPVPGRHGRTYPPSYYVHSGEQAHREADERLARMKDETRWNWCEKCERATPRDFCPICGNDKLKTPQSVHLANARLGPWPDGDYFAVSYENANPQVQRVWFDRKEAARPSIATEFALSQRHYVSSIVRCPACKGSGKKGFFRSTCPRCKGERVVTI